MFERFTEKARRAIFFSRYEASVLGSTTINPEHLLLGLLRECKIVRDQLKPETADLIRRHFRRESPDVIPTSVDLPVSADCGRIFQSASEEAESRGSQYIEGEHLFIGFLRLERSPVHAVIESLNGDLGLLLENVRSSLRPILSFTSNSPAQVRFGPELFISWVSALHGPSAAEFMSHQRSLTNLVLRTAEFIDYFSPSYGERRLHRKEWTRKQALAHLIDWAMQYRLWLAQASDNLYLRGVCFPAESWMAARSYQNVPWHFMVDSWFSANCLLISDIAALPSSKAALCCRIGVQPETTLERLLVHYVETVEDIMEQVLSRL